MPDGRYRTGDETADDQKSSWHKIVGESYIAEAFKAARAADPNAKLFYNDYYDHIAVKRDAIYNMLKGLLDSGVVVHGVGIQAHLNIEPSMDMTHQGYQQTVANIEAAIVKYASLGLEVQITEMDVSLYIPGITYTSDMFYTAATFTDALQTKQAERYRVFFDMFRAHKDVHHRRHPVGHRRRQHLALRVHLRPQGLPAAVRHQPPAQEGVLGRRRLLTSTASRRHAAMSASTAAS